MIKELVFFTYGDSNDASTWSNVPYLFSSTIESKGIKVHRIDISPNKTMRRVFDKLIVPLIRLFYPNHVYIFMRSRLFAFIVNNKIKRAVKKYNNSDLCIFTNFDYYNKFSNIPSLLFCDWTYDILIMDRLGRDTYFFEKLFSHQQEIAINHATTVISLFPECALSMKESYPSANIHYLGTNVINSFYDGILDREAIIEGKINSNSILFVGGKNYTEGAQKLVDAFCIFSNKYGNYTLNLIGIEPNWISFNSEKINCHGYLRKDNDRDKGLYYNLLLNSKFIINPTPKWAGYSSLIEAMYFFNPVITSNFKDFVNEFGECIDFGIYLHNYSVDNVAQKMDEMINAENYVEMCQNAHERVKGYTWDSFVDKILVDFR